MELDKTIPVVVLAIRIVDISASILEQHATLPPTAFARIIAWSHGQVSADTSSLSDWGNAKPVFLPIGAGGGGGAATELEISLWDNQPNAGDEASTAVLLDVGAEVTFPAPNDLGDSEQGAVEK